MGDAFVSLDHNWNYTFVNDKALTLMAKPKEELLGKSLWDVFPDVKGTMFETHFRKVMNERTPVSFEIYYPSYDMWLDVRTYAHDAGIAIFYTDISRHKKNEERIQSFNSELELKVKERTQELETANKELESFCYSISHDLRSPLRIIHGYTSILLEDYVKQLDKEAQRLGNGILSNTVKMGDLIDDLLDFSRLGRKELVKRSVPMGTMVQNIWNEFQRHEQQQHRAIDFRLNEIPEAMADDSTIKQVWANLVSNALKYTKHKEKTIIEVGCEGSGPGVTYYIRDNGIGFDMRYYHKLFGVFQRLHAPEEFEGTGVGLAIVQRIIAKHGGKIWAKAQPNEGATFYFSLQ
jgi:light-regulated signal transduction histidine kinase (bacteriophytochrome)